PYVGLALLAGFCEIGETPEDTVRREVMEEVGLRVTRVCYAGAQPWGFDHDLLLGYYCEVEDGEIRVDHSELRDAYWIRRSEIGELRDSASLTFHLIARFRDGFEPFAETPDFRVRHARAGELPEIMRIYARARDFMAAHGNPRQWSLNGWPPEALVRQDISRGKCYVCEADGALQAVFYYDFAEDVEPGYRGIEEGQWSQDVPYGVVHRVATAGTMKGAGTAAIRWALRQSGYLRIDTHPDNTVMQGLLTKLGFRYCGVIHVEQDPDPRKAYDIAAPAGGEREA
ncbi:MAG: NUDIX domain-containing protein, partial [Clostridia bacterium]|nr:NUDIX domain-containing protein [Clostridia bacterium]